MNSTGPVMYSPTPAALYSSSPVAAYTHPEGCFYHLSKPDSLQNIPAGDLHTDVSLEIFLNRNVECSNMLGKKKR
jgi:hypothetical protein